MTFRIATLIALMLASATSTPAAADRPNVVFIFADDVGWGDLGCYGQPRYRTPNLDRLARQGTLFTQFYVASGVCSPSRTAIMTGLFPARLGMHGHLSPKPGKNAERGIPDFLDPAVDNLARTLGEAGYAVGHFGKWHLGFTKQDAPRPDAYGFDAARTTQDWDLWSANARPRSTEMILDAAWGFIQEQGDRPFYVNAWLTDTHATLSPSEQQLARWDRLKPPGVDFYGATQVYAASLEAMDAQIGAFLDRLDEAGLGDNTLVVFSSDNGPEDITIRNAAHSGTGSAGPFRGRKRSLYEGGVRVPFLVRWPARVPAGRVDDDSVIGGVDFYPTVCRLLDADLPADAEIDGEDRSDCLLGTPSPRTKPLLWEWRYRVFGHVTHHSPRLAIRDGDWKLLFNPDRSRVELFDIPDDPREMTNLADEHPDVVERLSARALAWQATLPDGPLGAGAGTSEWRWPAEK